MAAIVGDQVRFGKRKDWLGDAPFFGWQLLAPALIEPLRSTLEPLGDVERMLGRLALGSARPRDLSGLRDALGSQIVGELLVRNVARKGYVLSVDKKVLRIS